MMIGSDPLDGKLQRAGITLILGLLVEGLCLLSKGPVAFILFVGVGGVLIAAGILLYLHSVISSSPADRATSHSRADLGANKS